MMGMRAVDLVRAERVVKSCVTLPQLRVAARYVALAERRGGEGSNLSLRMSLAIMAMEIIDRGGLGAGRV